MNMCGIGNDDERHDSGDESGRLLLAAESEEDLDYTVSGLSRVRLISRLFLLAIDFLDFFL